MYILTRTCSSSPSYYEDVLTTSPNPPLRDFGEGGTTSITNSMSRQDRLKLVVHGSCTSKQQPLATYVGLSYMDI